MRQKWFRLNREEWGLSLDARSMLMETDSYWSDYWTDASLHDASLSPLRFMLAETMRLAGDGRAFSPQQEGVLRLEGSRPGAEFDWGNYVTWWNESYPEGPMYVDFYRDFYEDRGPIRPMGWDVFVHLRQWAERSAEALPSKADTHFCYCMAVAWRDIVGYPPDEWRLNPQWRTTTAVRMAEHAWESRDWDSLPILADALQDAGCDDEGVLSHLRGGGFHCRGCRVIRAVLGDELSRTVAET